MRAILRFIADATAVAVLAIGSLLVVAPATALTATNYTPASLAAAQASGKPFLIDFFAT